MTSLHFIKFPRHTQPAAPDAVHELDVWKHSCSLLERRARQKAVRCVEQTIERLHNTPPDLRTFIELDLSGLSITDINWGPATYHRLEGLKNLFLENSRIKSLPDDIRLCRDLSLLRCDNTNLESLPDSLTECRDLQLLDVSHTRVKTVPAELFSMPYLHTLKLNNTHLEKLPGNIQSTAMLAELDLRNNQLTELPDLIKELGSTIVLAEGNTASVIALFK